MIRAGRPAALILLAGLAAAPTFAQAPSLGLGQGEGPIEIEATEQLEWRQEEQIYVASGDVRVRQDRGELRADEVTAYLGEGAADADGADGANVERLIAAGGVVITDGETEIRGGRAEYEVALGRLTITGAGLMLITKDETITATEALIYDEILGRTEAIGQAVWQRPGESVAADRFIGQFGLAEDGNPVLTTLDAFGGVEIVTGEDLAFADEAGYDIEAELATLTGRVRLIRGQNIIVGNRAELNLATGVNRLLPQQGSEGRVRALITPGGVAGDRGE